MSETYLFYSSIVVFSLMFIGLVITVIEFRYGAPRMQDEAAQAKRDEVKKEEQRSPSESKNQTKARQRDVV